MKYSALFVWKFVKMQKLKNSKLWIEYEQRIDYYKMHVTK